MSVTVLTMATLGQPQPQPAGWDRCATRRLLRVQRKVCKWWEALPAEARRSHYLGAQLRAATGVPGTSLGPALRALGWRREQVRINGKQVGVWVAPGAVSIKRPIGRPRSSTASMEGTQ